MTDTRTKLTLEALLARREQGAGAKKVFATFPVPELDGELVIEKLPVRRILSIIDGANLESLMEAVDANVSLIYACCPVFRNQELQAAYECDEPTDIVYRVFDDNIGAINRVAEFILSLYGASDKGLADEAVADIKN